MPKMLVFDTMDSRQNEIPVELYTKYTPANRLTKPSNQITLLFFRCIKEENNAVPKAVLFDLVIAFEAGDREAVRQRVEDEMHKRFPHNAFMATIDSDISD